MRGRPCGLWVQLQERRFGQERSGWLRGCCETAVCLARALPTWTFRVLRALAGDVSPAISSRCTHSALFNTHARLLLTGFSLSLSLKHTVHAPRTAFARGTRCAARLSCVRSVCRAHGSCAASGLQGGLRSLQPRTRAPALGLACHVRPSGPVHFARSVALACRAALNARLATGVGLSFLLAFRTRVRPAPGLGRHTRRHRRRRQRPQLWQQGLAEGSRGGEGRRGTPPSPLGFKGPQHGHAQAVSSRHQTSQQQTSDQPATDSTRRPHRAQPVSPPLPPARRPGPPPPPPQPSATPAEPACGPSQIIQAKRSDGHSARVLVRPSAHTAALPFGLGRPYVQGYDLIKHVTRAAV